MCLFCLRFIGNDQADCYEIILKYSTYFAEQFRPCQVFFTDCETKWSHSIAVIYLPQLRTAFYLLVMELKGNLLPVILSLLRKEMKFPTNMLLISLSNDYLYKFIVHILHLQIWQFISYDVFLIQAYRMVEEVVEGVVSQTAGRPWVV